MKYKVGDIVGYIGSNNKLRGCSDLIVTGVFKNQNRYEVTRTGNRFYTVNEEDFIPITVGNSGKAGQVMSSTGWVVSPAYNLNSNIADEVVVALPHSQALLEPLSCVHEYVDVGFRFTTMVCKKCNKEQGT